MTNALRSAVHDLASLSIGADPLVPGVILEQLRAAAGGSGPGGIFMLAFSAIDIALWDIRGKALNQPLWKMLGGGRRQVPAYASGTLQRSLSDGEAAQAARCLVERGFRQIKMQLGLAGEHSPAKEVERARMVREMVGPGIKLMADVNQGWHLRRTGDAGGRWRIRLGHGPIPAHAGSALG
jgi:L-alanine-DL-glutamate epimerase-like enolase superfamily enzyme